MAVRYNSLGFNYSFIHSISLNTLKSLRDFQRQRLKRGFPKVPEHRPKIRFGPIL